MNRGGAGRTRGATAATRRVYARFLYARVLPASLVLSACTGPATGPRTPRTPPGDNNESILAFQHVYVGSTHACALANGGNALCWGSGGDLGDGTTESQPAPVLVQGPQIFGELDASSFTCGVTTNGVVWCWGTNEEGRIGDGSTEYRPFPTRIASTARFQGVTAGSVHACALNDADALWCWGSNRFEQLGSHPDTLSLVPIPIGVGQRFKAVDGGSLTTCAIDMAGTTWCWGDVYGPDLVEIAGGLEFTTVTVGGVHACGLTADGQAFCFGSNTEGQLGDGSFVSTPPTGPPVAVDTDERFVAISGGGFHTCAITAEGAAWCWGRDDVGQLGDGDPVSGRDPSKKASPTLVLAENSFVDFTTISAGRFASCGTTADGRAFCWGFGTGSPSRPSSSTPVELGS